MKRTGYCGSFKESDVGRSVTACGWLITKRDMGGVIFADLRDREGTLQVVFNAASISAAEFAAIERLRNQSVISVSGIIRLRDEETINPKIATGTVELAASKLEVLSEAAPLPFNIDDQSVREDARLKYRFLDIRNPALQSALRFRHAVQKAAQDYLDADGFTYVETPTLTKSTPEGARDYIVPSRVHPGTFYALPQSPQIFKQLLMVGGIDKYYQVARCYRDEDLRADRQPEFTQVDMEMSFIDQEDILQHLERLFKHIFAQTMGITFDKPFRRMTWLHAMDVYGSDKPDTRFDLPITDVTDIAAQSSFSVFKSAIKSGGVVRAICIKGGADMTRTDIETLTEKAIGYGAKGMAWIMLRETGEVYSILTKYFTEEQIAGISSTVGADNGDFILFCADSIDIVRRTLGGLRGDIADMRGLREKNIAEGNSDKYSFLIVTEFPQFEYSPLEKRWVAMHHPFTMPRAEDIPYLTSDPGRVRAQAYDIVLNGVELGSGSIRIHHSETQQKMFAALGFSPEEIENRFGFMVNAFKYGTPPHGGFAFGLDRLVMLMTGAQSLRDVIAFPKTREASCLMTDAPGAVDQKQLDDLKLGSAQPVREDKKQAKAKDNTLDLELISELSMLPVTDENADGIAAEIERLMAQTGQFTASVPDDAAVMITPVTLTNVLREDAVKISPPREKMLQNAPMGDGEYAIVPKVVG